MEEIEKLDQTGTNVSKFCKATQEKIDAGLLVPNVIVISDESESEEMEIEDDWKKALLLFVDDDGYEADTESDAFDEIVTLMMELLDDEIAQQVEDTEDEDAEGKFSLYYIG